MAPSLSAVAGQLLGVVGSSDCWSEGASDMFTPDSTLVALNKKDLIEEEVGQQMREVVRNNCGGAEICLMSCKTGDGMETFMGHLVEMLRSM